MKWRTLAVGLGLLFLCLFFFTRSGGIHEEVVHGVSTFAFETWVPWVSGCVLAVMAVAGRILAKADCADGHGFFAVSVLCLIACVPGLSTQRVIVDANHVSINVGVLWMFPTKHEIQFAEIDRIVMERPKALVSPPGSANRILFHTKQGQIIEVETGRLLKVASDRISDAARQQGVRVTNRRPAGN